MAKKKHRQNRGATAGCDDKGGSENASVQQEFCRTGDGPSSGDIEVALRAVRWLSSVAAGVGGQTRETLLDAARPLIAARAAKYEEDAKASKLAEVAAGTLGAHAKLLQSLGPGAARKRQRTENGSVSETASVAVESPPEAELGRAIDVLRSLGNEGEVLAGKECKPLRAALHPLVEAHLQEEKASPTFRITCMLGQPSRWPDALQLINEMRNWDLARRPKLGAYQRWIRELNIAEGNPEELAMLDAIMRVATGLPAAQTYPPTKGALTRLPPFDKHAGSANGTTQVVASAAAPTEATSKNGEAATAPAASTTDGEQVCGEQSVASKLTAAIVAGKAEVAAAAAVAKAAGLPGCWEVLAHEAAHERKPPNHFDLDIYTCSQSALALSSTSPPVTRWPLRGVEGAFVLSDVLSSAECSMLRALSERIGYRPDVPLSSTLDERAQNVVLMASEEQCSALFGRVRPQLPQELGGQRLLGINRRWRLYRYDTGNLYRKHLDGAWPASGVVTSTAGRPQYRYDAHGGAVRSRLTFIVYLNDDFEGGHTTFFVPAEGAEGTLEARSVQPRVGCATVFPHGEVPAPLLHEGSSVTKGTKYLLRTDVLYSMEQDSQVTKDAARLRGLARQLGALGGQDLLTKGATEAEQHTKKAGKTKKKKKGSKTDAPPEGKLDTAANRGKKRRREESGEGVSSKRGKTNKNRSKTSNSESMVAHAGSKNKSTRRRDAKAAAKLRTVGRLQIGSKAGSA